ncbi:MAG: hypothetical protein VX185_16815 [Pseudomonadota bacterium]|nr:hypothetical protein [Pseudomonadota bacterium]
MDCSDRGSRVKNYIMAAGAVLTMGVSVPAMAVDNDILIDNFETLALGVPWPKVSDTEIIDHCGLSDDSNKCLRVTYTPEWNGSTRLTRNIEIPAHDHYVLSYDVMFEEGFEFVQGGKLHGLGPETPVTGCDTVNPEGWSARVVWGPNGSVRNYFYDQDKQEACGVGSYSASRTFEAGKWSHVQLEVKLNTAAAPTSGYVKMTVDDQVVAFNKNLHLRSTFNNDSLIQNLMFSTFFGGNTEDWAPSKTVHARFDNFKVVPKGTISSAVQTAIDNTQYSLNRILAPRLYVKDTNTSRSNILQMIGFEDIAAGEHTNEEFEEEYGATQWIVGSSAGRALIDSNRALTTPGQSLKVTMPASASGLETGIKWQMSVPSSRSLSLSYWVYFDGDYNFSSGGILPGLTNVNQSSSQAWQALVSWRESGYLDLDIQNDNSYASHKLNYQGSDARLSKAEWHFIQLKVSLGSTQGQDRAEVWLDHEKVGDLQGLNLAAGLSGNINAMLMSSYLKTDNKSGNQELWFDDVVVSKEPL